MEPSRSAKAHDPQDRRKKRTAVVGLLLAGGLAGPAPVAKAAPSPGMDALRQQADRLNTQLEQLTEQYNGLKVRLTQAQRAAAIAKETSRRETRTLKGMQHQIGRLAALRYMNGGTEDAPAIFASSDPRTLLDQVATLRYFTQQDDSQVRMITQVIQNAERSGQDAEDRAAQEVRLEASCGRRRRSSRRR